MRFEKQFCDWLGVDSLGLNFMLNRHRNEMFWEPAGPERWLYRGLSTLHPDVPELDATPIDFIANSTLAYDREDGYITIGKGWP